MLRGTLKSFVKIHLPNGRKTGAVLDTFDEQVCSPNFILYLSLQNQLEKYLIYLQLMLEKEGKLVKKDCVK